MISIDKNLLLPDGRPNIVLLEAVRKAHEETGKRLEGLRDVYNRKHDIANRTRLRGLPNNKLAHDLPGYIVTMSAGYLVGNPVSYAPKKGEETAFDQIKDALKAAISDNVDAELAVDAAVCGKGVEICYADEQARPKIAQVDPVKAFVVYDDTVEHNPLFGVTANDILGEDLKIKGERITVYTANEAIRYETSGVGGTPREVSSEAHFFGGVPLIEYWNNSREQGDFEPVVDLINAYDALQSDRVNDKQQFTDSILAFYGIGELGSDDTVEHDPTETEGDEVPQEKKDTLTPSQRLRQTKMLFMPAEGAKAEWVTKPQAESDAEILRRSLKTDIHKLCMVPDLTDENFAGNASGVAMRYKLLGPEQLTKIKERWFREGLRQRLRLFSAFLSVRGAADIDVDEVQITFKRSLPVNETEIASMVSAYDGIVPRQLLLGQIPFVEDAVAAIEMLQREKVQAVKNQQAMMTPSPFRQNEESVPDKIQLEDKM